MEFAAKKVEGVKDVTVNFMLLKMTVDFEEGVNEADVMKKVKKACKRVEPDCEVYC